MYTINSIVAFALFQALCTPLVNCYALSPADPTITPAPERNLLLQARQASRTETCTRWTIPGIGNPICSSGSSCYHETASTGYAGCFPSLATAAAYSTACHGYPAIWPGVASPSYERYCSATAPSCGAIIFIDATGRWTDYICDSTAYLYTAFHASLLVSTTAPVIPVIPTPTVSSTPYPTSTSISDSGSSTSNSVSTSTSPTPSPTPASTPSSNAAVIGGAVGGAVGGLALVIGAVVIFFCMRKRNRHNMQPQGAGIAVEQSPPEYKSPPPVSQPPREFHAPAMENKNPAYVSEHC